MAKAIINGHVICGTSEGGGLKPITHQLVLEEGFSSTEPTNCTYTVIGNICIVNLAGLNYSGAELGVIAYNLPKAKTRQNLTTHDDRIIFIDGSYSQLNVTGNISGIYEQLIYPIED